MKEYDDNQYNNNLNNRNISNKKYLQNLQDIADKKLTKFTIYLDDLDRHFSIKNPYLTEKIKVNSKRYIALFSNIVDKLIPTSSIYLNRNDIDTIEELYLTQRMANVFDNRGILERGLTPEDREKLRSIYPPEMLRKYTVVFAYTENEKVKLGS